MLHILQVDTRASASLTLTHKSCPAGFEIMAGIVPGRYSCQCSKVNLNIQSCNETTDDLLLKVRMLCMCTYMIQGTAWPSCQSCSILHVCPTFPFLSPLCSPPHQPSCAPSLILCRTGCGALPSPTQMATSSCSPQAVLVVTATASCGTQTMRQSAGSLCLRTWPRGTSSALATDKVRCEIGLG